MSISKARNESLKADTTTFTHNQFAVRCDVAFTDDTVDSFKNHYCLNLDLSKYKIILTHFNLRGKRLRWSRVSVLVFGTHVRGFKPGRSLSTTCFGREVKPSVPCRIFVTRKCMCGSRSFRSKLPAISSPSSFNLSLLGSLVETPGGASRKD